MKQAVRPFLLPLLFVLASCSKEPKPTTVGAFIDNPRLLEAAMLRCGQNRSELKYSQECLNAREAVNRLDAVEEAAKREELDRQSERKRQALRRTQEAAAAARRRAEEQRRVREELEYQQIFEQSLGGDSNAEPGNTDGGIAGESAEFTDSQPGTNAGSQASPQAPVSDLPDATVPDALEISTPGGNAPTDINAIREELKRRQEAPPEN